MPIYAWGAYNLEDLLVSEVLRTNELQVWFLAEHLIALPIVEGTEPASGESDEKQPGSKTLAPH
jgi:hypothetical protein